MMCRVSILVVLDLASKRAVFISLFRVIMVSILVVLDLASKPFGEPNGFGRLWLRRFFANSKTAQRMLGKTILLGDRLDSRIFISLLKLYMAERCDRSGH